MINVAINGFGRIGRAVYRVLSHQQDIQVVAVNDLTSPETLAYLLKHDTVMGAFPYPIELSDKTIHTNKQKTHITNISDLSNLDWKKFNVDIVIEATGRFVEKASLEKHLAAGAKRVILTVPPKDSLDAMIVLGVNDSTLTSAHKLISNASCTTNCLTPMIKILDEAFGLERAYMTTVHAYTNDQRLSDMYHKDFRRARAANENIIPTTTGAARAVGKILPHLNGKIDGSSVRVPIADGSIVDLSAVLKKPATVKEINAAFEKAANGNLKGIVEYSTEALVSSDIIQNPHSTIFDSEFTKVIGGTFVKVLAWYDNEWGYSNRVCDLVKKLSSL